MTILLVLIGILIGVTTVYFILKPRLNAQEQIDEEIRQKNAEAKALNQELNANTIQLKSEYSALVEKTLIQEQYIKNIQKQAEESANTIYEKSFELANEKMSVAADKLAADFEIAKQQIEKEYIELMAMYSADFNKELSATNIAIKSAESQLADLSAKVFAAVEAAKRQEEMETAQDFYRLNLSEIDIEEIIKLREVTALLRDSEPLNKVIWKVYYEKPYTDLIGRVVGSGTHTGIYKITNIESQKCYVGQAADIASRWKQHIKRGIGAEAPTRNKLYPAMLKHGVENFTFEIVEECSRDKLNEREDYWQDYFGAKEFGYSIK